MTEHHDNRQGSLLNGSFRLGEKLVSAVVGACLGVALTYVTAVSEHSREIGQLTERIVALSAKIDTIETSVSDDIDDRYRSAEARRDLALVQQQISQNAKAITRLETIMTNHANRDHSGQ